jgi:hypothetical protein
MIISNKELTCVDCGEVVTPEQMKKDEMRIHKYNDSFYCELCYEDLKEQIYDSMD